MDICTDPLITDIPRQAAFGISFDDIDLEDACDIFAARPPEAPFGYLVTPNAMHVVHVFRGDQRFIDGINAAEFVTCDSRIVRNLLRRLFNRRLPVATGSDITARLLERVITPQDTITVIGGDQALATTIRENYGLRCLSIHVPVMGFIKNPVAVQECVDFVRDHPARFVFLACGAPQSEMLAAEICRKGGSTGLGLCIGASLLFVTGRIARAPQWMQRMSLEWLHRLALDPRRLAGRMWTSQLPLLWVALCYRFARPIPTVSISYQNRAAPWRYSVLK